MNYEVINPFMGLINACLGLINACLGLMKAFMVLINPFIGLINPLMGLINPFMGFTNPFTGLIRGSGHSSKRPLDVSNFLLPTFQSVAEQSVVFCCCFRQNAEGGLAKGGF